MTPEEKIAEKLRRKQLEEEADMKFAMETFGVTDLGSGEGIDGMVPRTKEEFTELAEAISKKVGLFRNKDEFPTFVEDVVRGISIHCEFNHLQGIKQTLLISPLIFQ